MGCDLGVSGLRAFWDCILLFGFGVSSLWVISWFSWLIVGVSFGSFCCVVFWLVADLVKCGFAYCVLF